MKQLQRNFSYQKFSLVICLPTSPANAISATHNQHRASPVWPTCIYSMYIPGNDSIDHFLAGDHRPVLSIGQVPAISAMLYMSPSLFFSEPLCPHPACLPLGSGNLGAARCPTGLSGLSLSRTPDRQYALSKEFNSLLYLYTISPSPWRWPNQWQAFPSLWGLQLVTNGLFITRHIRKAEKNPKWTDWRNSQDECCRNAKNCRTQDAAILCPSLRITGAGQWCYMQCVMLALDTQTSSLGFW